MADSHREADSWKSVGNRHMASKEYEDAYKAYCHAIQISPLGPSSHIYLCNRAAALLSLKRYSAASVDARRAITLAPTFGKAHARLGQSLYFLKDYAGAIAAYENAFQFEPDNQVTWTYLNKAKKKFARENERRRRKEEEDFDRKQQSQHEGRKKQAIDRGIEEVMEDMNVSREEENYNAMNDHAQDDGLSVAETVDLANMALSVAENAHDLSTSIIGPSTTDDELDREESKALSANRNRNAVSSVHAALDNDQARLDLTHETEESDENEDDPDFDEALRLQESAALKLLNKQYREAVEEFSAALFLVPDDDNLTPQLYVGRANALNGLERHEGALNDAMMALGRDPDMGEAHLVLARTYFYLKDYNESIQSFENALECLGELSALDQLYLSKAHELSEVASLDLDSDHPRHAFNRQSASKPVPKLKPPRFVSRKQQLASTQNVPSMPKKWAEQLQISELPETLKVGPERVVTFLSAAMGVKLNRGPDGIIRVLSVASLDQRPDISRQGDIYPGDILREAAGVDLRRPLTNVMWSDTVALLKIAPRPLVIKVAMELSKKLPAVQKEFDLASQESADDSNFQDFRTPKQARSQRPSMMSPPSC